MTVPPGTHAQHQVAASGDPKSPADAPPGALPRDRAFWAEYGPGEIERVRYDDSSYTDYPMFAPLDDGDDYYGEPLIWARDITDWDDDRDALEARIASPLAGRDPRGVADASSCPGLNQ